jgi:hypothetical protein
MDLLKLVSLSHKPKFWKTEFVLILKFIFTIIPPKKTAQSLSRIRKPKEFPMTTLKNHERRKEKLKFFPVAVSLSFWGLFFFIPNGLAGEKITMADLQWPASINGWTWDKEDRVFDRETLYNHIDGAAEVYLSYNFQKAFVRRFVKPGHPDIVAEIYRMGSSVDAFGIFSLEQQDPEAGIGQGSEFGGSLLRFWKGNIFVSILGEGEGKDLEAALLTLGRKLAEGLEITGALPEALQFLPDNLPGFTAKEKLCFLRSHILLNRCYFLSHANILNLEKDVEAVFARYSQGPIKIRLVIVQYPSEPRAGAAFNAFTSAFMPEAGQDHLVRLEDQTWAKAERHRNFIVLVFGSTQSGQTEEISRAVIKRIKEKRS